MRAETRVLVVLSLAIGCISFSWANYPAVLPLVIDDLAFSGTEAGVVFSAYFVGYLLAIMPVGVLADRYSPRQVVGITAVGTGAFGVAFALLTVDVVTGSLFRLAAGACFAGVYVPGMRLLADWFEPGERGRAFGIYVGVLSVGSGLAYPTAAWIAAVLDWRVALTLTSAVSIPAGLAVVWLAGDHPSSSERRGSFDLTIFTDRSYLYATTAYASHNWELFAIQSWIVVFLVATPAVAATGSPAVTAGVLAGLLAALGGPGNALGGWLSDRTGRITTSALALGTSGAILVSFGLLSWESLAVLVTVVLVYGIVVAADSAPLSTAITELVDDEQVGTALAGQSLLGFLPGVISPVVFGAALDVADFTAAFATLVGGVVVGLLALWLLRREIRGPLVDPAVD